LSIILVLTSSNEASVGVTGIASLKSASNGIEGARLAKSIATVLASSKVASVRA
jgi:hypothetical protein